MRIDFDLVKEILLKIEDETLDFEFLGDFNNFENFTYKELEFYSEKAKEKKDIFLFHLNYLRNDEFLIQNIGISKNIDGWTLMQENRIPPQLTAQGVHFLNQIRDKNLFSKAKENLVEAGIEITKATLTQIVSSLILVKI